MGIVFQVSNTLPKIKCTVLRYWWLSSMATSISIYTNALSEVRPQQTKRCFASHHDRRTQGQAIFSYWDI